MGRPGRSLVFGYPFQSCALVPRSPIPVLGLAAAARWPGFVFVRIVHSATIRGCKVYSTARVQRAGSRRLHKLRTTTVRRRCCRCPPLRRPCEVALTPPGPWVAAGIRHLAHGCSVFSDQRLQEMLLQPAPFVTQPLAPLAPLAQQLHIAVPHAVPHAVAHLADGLPAHTPGHTPTHTLQVQGAGGETILVQHSVVLSAIPPASPLPLPLAECE